MKFKIFWISLIVIVFSFPSICFSEQPTNKIKEDYELQVRCGKQSDDEFKKVYGNGLVDTKDSDMMVTYQNHYNKKLNKCFIIVFVTNYPKDMKTDVWSMKTLYDINENKQYGTMSKVRGNNHPFICNFLDKSCKSEEEWNSLVKPYMEE